MSLFINWSSVVWTVSFPTCNTHGRTIYFISCGETGNSIQVSPINSLKEGQRVCISSHLFQLCVRVISFELRGKAARDLSVFLHTGIVRGKTWANSSDQASIQYVAMNWRCVVLTSCLGCQNIVCKECNNNKSDTNDIQKGKWMFSSYWTNWNWPPWLWVLIFPFVCPFMPSDSFQYTKDLDCMVCRFGLT